MKPDIYQKLASTGRYHNTGKVLIGVSYVPQKKRIMSRDEERLQSVLLGHPIPAFKYDLTIYLLYAMGVGMLFWALAEAFR